MKKILILIVFLFSISAFAQVDNQNLLSDARVIKSRGVSDIPLLTDNWIAQDGWGAKGKESAMMKGLRPYVIWDLGAQKNIRSAALQADNNDIYRLSISNDGKKFEPIWIVPTVQTMGVIQRGVIDLDANGRYLRLDCTRGDAIKSATELRVYDHVPAPFPPQIKTGAQLDYSADDILGTQIYAVNIVCGLFVLAFLFYIYPRVKKRLPKIILLAIFTILVASSWFKFGNFNGDNSLQIWDGYHYFMSSKYFDEIGYFDLYRCVAKAQREDGFSNEVDGALIRNLDDNTLNPGTWTATHEGRCRGEFSSARWLNFKEDVASYKKLFPKNIPITRSFIDHGFNATPIHAGWLHFVTKHIPLSRGALIGLAQIDNISIFLAFAFLWWAFGPVVAIGGAITMSIGFAWGYQWTGGSLGRFPWFFFAASGLSLLKKEHSFAGAFMLTMSGLLRLFPFAFVGGLGLYTIIKWIRNRRLNKEGKNILSGVALAMLIGITFGGVSIGFKSYPQFLKVAKVHAGTPLVNHMGLPMVTGFAEGDIAKDLHSPALSDPDSIWKQKIKLNRKTRAPILIFAIAVSFAFIIFTAIRGYEHWQVAASAGPFLFALHNMTSYDYVWIILMLPLGIVALHRIRWVIYYAILTTIIGLTIVDMEVQHLLFSFGFLILMIMFIKDIFFELGGLDKKPDLTNTK